MSTDPYAAYAVKDRSHPEWCVGGHRCSASWRTGGEHASLPEVWAASAGSVVAVRYRSRDARHDHIQVTVSAPLDHTDEDRAQLQARAVIATVYAAVAQLAELDTAAAHTNPTDLKGHLR